MKDLAVVEAFHEPCGNPKVLECARCAALFGIAPRPKAAQSAALQDADALSCGGFMVPMQDLAIVEAFPEPCI